MSAAPVRVIDAKTGEILREVPASDFRPRAPKRPVLDESRIEMVRRGNDEGPTGRTVVYVASHREAVVDYWGHFAHTLSRPEQRAIASGRTSSVLRPIPPSWKQGDRMYVAADVEAEVAEMTESARGFGTVFKIHDHRTRYLRRGVIGNEVPLIDRHGYPAELDDDEERLAAIDSAYTTVSGQAVDEAGAVMDDAAYETIHPDRSAQGGLTRGRRRVRVTQRKLEERIERERSKKHRRSTVRRLERQLASLRRKRAA